MSKFKIGDVVRLRKDWSDNQSSRGFLASEGITFEGTYNVERLDHNNQVFVRGHSYNEERFELATKINYPPLNKTVVWVESASRAITEAGGVPEIVLETFSEELLNTLIRKNIHLVHKGND